MKMLTLFLIACATSAACWHPTSFPVTVTIDGDLTPAQVSTIIDGIVRVNDAAERRVFRFRIAHAPFEHRSGVYFSNERPKKSVGRSGGFARILATHCSVRVGDRVIESVVVHELAHCLGFDHEDDVESIMNERASGHLKPMHVEKLRSMIDGKTR